MKHRIPFGAGAAALGVAAASLLGPQAASAMTFTFSFEDSFDGVSGLISGLGEGSNPCNTTQPSCQVFVLNARSNPQLAGLYRVDESAASDGFEVSPQGVITSADFFAFKFVDTPVPKAILLKFSQNRFVGLPGVADETSVGCLDESGESFACLIGSATRGVATFTRRVSRTPSPAPPPSWELPLHSAPAAG